MSEFFFDIPWYVPVMLIVGGIALFFWANNRVRRHEKNIAGGLVALAILLLAVSYFFETDSEVVLRRTREFVQAVIARDATGIGALLDARASAYAWDKKEIIDGAVYYATDTGLAGARIMSLSVEKDGNDRAAALSVWSQHTGGNRFPVTDLNSTWKLLWVKRGKDWLILSITPIQIGQTMREDIERQYLDRPVRSR